MRWGDDFGYRDYVPVGQKLANANQYARDVASKSGREPSPVKPAGRTITKTFWGTAWCDNLKAYSDYSNRLPRGATYLRNGSVVDLVITPGAVEAIVAGSDPYEIEIQIEKLPKAEWTRLKEDCSASIDSLLDLLAGKFSKGVMARLTQKTGGLFPSPKQISMSCSCPDYSSCCKHLAAVMYGIGCRLDTQPELLFVLRGVDHMELISEAVAEGNLDRELTDSSDNSLAGVDLGALFGIELEQPSAPVTTAVPAKSPRKATVKKAVKGVSAKKTATDKKSTRKPVPKSSVSNVAVDATKIKKQPVKTAVKKKVAKSRVPKRPK
ncbi:MAG: SWIM zinc finger family protein [Planctomycetota bacterium]